MLRALVPPVPIVCRHPWVPGFRVRLNLRRHVTYWKHGLAAYEPHVARLLLRVVGHDDDVVEVGTHIGFFTLMLAHQARNVVALEPDSGNLTSTRRNLVRNGAPGARLFPYAAGDREGDESFRLDPVTGAAGRLDAEASGLASRSVRVVRLDRFLATEVGGLVPSFVKIDAEGAEDRVLDGMGRLLDGATRVLVEVGEATKVPAQERLRRHGYRLFNPHADAWQPAGTHAGWHVYATKRDEPNLPAM